MSLFNSKLILRGRVPGGGKFQMLEKNGKENNLFVNKARGRVSKPDSQPAVLLFRFGCGPAMLANQVLGEFLPCAAVIVKGPFTGVSGVLKPHDAVRVGDS